MARLSVGERQQTAIIAESERYIENRPDGVTDAVKSFDKEIQKRRGNEEKKINLPGAYMKRLYNQFVRKNSVKPIALDKPEQPQISVAAEYKGPLGPTPGTPEYEQWMAAGCPDVEQGSKGDRRHELERS